MAENKEIICQCPACGHQQTVANLPVLSEGVFFAWRCIACSLANEVRIAYWPADERQIVEAAHAH